MADLEIGLPGFAREVSEPEFGNTVAVALSAPIKALGETPQVSRQRLGEDLLEILIPEEELGAETIADMVRLTRSVKKGTRELKTLMVQVRPCDKIPNLGLGCRGTVPGMGQGRH